MANRACVLRQDPDRTRLTDAPADLAAVFARGGGWSSRGARRQRPPTGWFRDTMLQPALCEIDGSADGQGDRDLSRVRASSLTLF
jgi:hypothetical protein